MKNNVYLKRAVVGVGATMLLHGTGVFAEEMTVQQRIDKLEMEIQQLKSDSSKVASYGTSFSYGGYVKVDTMISEFSEGNRATSAVGDDLLVASTIPTAGSSGDPRFDMNAKTTRFWFKTKTGNVSTHVELDFLNYGQGDERITNSYSPRIRHAFVSWDYDQNSSFLAGQTWSTFFNTGSLPETLDFVGPVGTIFERQSQLRWTHKMGSNSLMVALENPSTGLYPGGGVAGSNNYDDNAVPDVAARYNVAAGAGSYSAALVVRDITYDDTTTGLDDNATGYAISLSGKYAIGKDDIKFQLNAGNALGRYMGLQTFQDGVIEAGGDIELIDQMGGFVSYRHFWNEKWRSTFVLSASSADNPNTVAATTASDYKSAHANLLYSPVANLTLGGELIHAEKELENGDSGKLARLLLSVKYVF